MKHVIVLFIMLFSISLLGQNSANKIKWKHKLGFTNKKALFIGNTDKKFIWAKRKEDSNYFDYHKKAEAQELYIYDVAKNKTETFEVNVEQDQWFINFKIHGDRLHVFMACYDEKAKQVAYWYKAYDTSDMSEAVAWKLLGKVDESVKKWKNSNFKLHSTEVNPQTGAVYVYFYSSRCEQGYGLVINSKGEITKQKDYPDDFKSDELKKQERVGRLDQMLLVGKNDNKLIHIYRESELERRRLQHQLLSSRLLVVVTDLEKGKHTTSVIEDENLLFLTGYITNKDINDEILVTTISIQKKDVSYTRFEDETYSLFSISNENEVKLLDELKTDRIHPNYYLWGRSTQILNTSLEWDKDRTSVFFGSRRAGFDSKSGGIVENERMASSVLVNTKEKKLEWDVPILYFKLEHFHVNGYKKEYIPYMDNGGINVNVGLQRFQIADGGKMEELETIPNKRDKKFKKKITPFFSHGYVERTDDFVIVGSDTGIELYIGTLKK